MSDEEQRLIEQHLRAVQGSLLWKLEGLSDDDLRRPMTKTGTNLVGIVKHLTGVTYGYLCGAFGRETEALPWAPGGNPDGIEPGLDMWATPDESCAEIIAAYRRACKAGLRAIAELGLDSTFTHSSGMKVSLRYMAMIVLLDTTRHTGHADVVRESIDGRVGSGRGDAMSAGDYDEELLKMRLARRTGEIDREAWITYVRDRSAVPEPSAATPRKKKPAKGAAKKQAAKNTPASKATTAKKATAKSLKR